MAAFIALLLLAQFSCLAHGAPTELTVVDSLLVGVAALGKEGADALAKKTANTVDVIFHKGIKRASSTVQASTTPPPEITVNTSASTTPPASTLQSSTTLPASTRVAQSSLPPVTTGTPITTLPPATTGAPITTLPPVTTGAPLTTLPPATTPLSCPGTTTSAPINLVGDVDPTLFSYPGFTYQAGQFERSAAGQTFTPSAGATVKSFAFDMRIPPRQFSPGQNPDLKFAAYLYAWDATKPGPTGPQLYASDPRSLSTPLGEVVTFNVPGCLTLTGSTEYVAFLSSAGFWPGGSQKVTLIDSSSTTLAGSRRISSTTASNSTATFQTTDMWAAQPAPPLGKNIALSVTYY